jgi:hypothetical protein
VAASLADGTEPLPDTDSRPDSVPADGTIVAPVARSGLDTIAPPVVAPPASTVIGPLTLAPGAVQNASPAAIVTAAGFPVRHGPVEVTLSVFATNGPKP